MNKLRLAALPALLLAFLVAGCGGGSSADDVPKDAVAVVDGREIPRSEFDTLMTQARASFKAQKREFPAAGSAEFQTLRDQAVEHLIQKVELEQAAEEMDISVTDADVDKRLEEITKQYYQGDQKKLDKQLKDQNLTLADVKEDIRGQIVSERIYNKVTADVKVSDVDVRKFYEQNKAQYKQAESREVRHILIKKRPAAESVRAELTPNGSNFAQLARQHSEDTGSKASGGKLTITRGQTVAAFDKTAFELKQNEISGLVKTEFGFHIIQALSKVKPATTTPLKDVQEQIRTQLLQTKKNETMTAWVEDLKSDYEDKITYAVGFNPPPAAVTGSTGTTTNEQ